VSRYEQVNAVEATITRMVNAIDAKDWKTALGQFAAVVFVDYSSMSGEPGAEVDAADLVGGWEQLLAEANTHHMLTNFEISVDGADAESIAHVYASHTAAGIDYWDIFGRYHHKLKLTDDGWRIAFMKLIVHGQKGNERFLEQLSTGKS
jgi:ketosteroid isomerase-like protein